MGMSNTGNTSNYNPYSTNSASNNNPYGGNTGMGGSYGNQGGYNAYGASQGGYGMNQNNQFGSQPQPQVVTQKEVNNTPFDF